MVNNKTTNNERRWGDLDARKTVCINSKSFLISLVLKYNLDPTYVYSCKGVYSKKLNAVIVSLDESNLDLYNIIEPQG